MRELEIGRIVVTHEIAIATAAGALRDSAGLRLVGYELLALQDGWVWGVYLGTEGVSTHVAFVHADGNLMTGDFVESLLALDELCGGNLRSMESAGRVINRALDHGALLDAYLSFVSAEYGTITFEGLPGDVHLRTRQFRLESAMVPIRLTRLALPPTSQRSAHSIPSRALGDVLRDNPVMIVVGSPGAGKTTLIKRLATSYANPNSRSEVHDSLPEEDALPLVIRCRDLHQEHGTGLAAILRTIASRAQLGEGSEAFVSLATEQLRVGRALVLIDGLDEMPEKPRRQFAAELRTTLAIYPHTRMVLTSRDAAIRTVEATLRPLGTFYRIADLTNEEIGELVAVWFRETGERGDPAALAQYICSHDRITLLARNPLLLTTMLLVHRTMRNLPAQRSVLYSEAIRVLVRTWNVEGHEALDENETVIQLAYVAFSMMALGIQRVSALRLVEMLTAARSRFSAVLAYTRLSVSEFVQRVEDRSSLLVWSGSELEDGILQSFYEFKHLSFQEYLAAFAIARGCVPAGSMDPPTDMRETLFAEDRVLNAQWQEVVPLTTVLAGPRGASLIRALLDRLKSTSADPVMAETWALILTRCLTEESQIEPDLVEECFDGLIRGTPARSRVGSLVPLASGRYRPLLARLLARLVGTDDIDQASVTDAIQDFIDSMPPSPESPEGWHGAIEDVVIKLNSDDSMDQVLGACILRRLARLAKSGAIPVHISGDLELGLINRLALLLSSSVPGSVVAIATVIEDLAGISELRNLIGADVSDRLFSVWRSANRRDERLAVGGAFSALSAKVLPSRRDIPLAFHVLLDPYDDANGLARLLDDVHIPQTDADASFDAPGDWLTALANSSGTEYPVFLAIDEPSLAERLLDIRGTVYLGMRSLEEGWRYARNDRIIMFLAGGPLDFVTVIMMDFSDDGTDSVHLFDRGEALRMAELASDFPIDLDDNSFDFGEDDVSGASDASHPI